MHQSALKYGKAFFETYLSLIPPTGLFVVDVGSLDVNGSLRSFAPNGSRYVGADFAEGPGVDVLLSDPYTLPFGTGTVDAVLCSSVFEHSEFFWLLFLECLRILKPEGLLYLNAPSNGMVHRYPIDGWRFYPDAGRALVSWARRNSQPAELLESFIAPKLGPIEVEGMWNDFVAVLVKDERHSSLYARRLIDGEPEAFCGYALGRDIPWVPGQTNPDNAQLVRQEAELTEWARQQVERDAQIASLNQAVTERDGQIASLNQAVTERDAQIASLNQAVEALRNSTSWRITAPIRIIVHQVKRAQHVASVLPAIVRQAGGVHLTAAKAWRVFQREGMQGLVLRWRAHHLPTSSPASAGRNDYQEWIRRFDTLDDEQRLHMHDALQHWASPPLISVVMPTYNADPVWLSLAIESVQAQLYPHWELCIADDASTDPRIRPLLEGFAQQDARIKVQFRTQNGHISAASNTALGMATGQWVALLDHDDVLSENALFYVAQCIMAQPHVRMIYSDEDKIDEKGQRHGPYFKCDWNPDLFYSHNMFCHLGVYHLGLVQSVGGFRAGLEGAQDYDLALRCTEQVSAEQIAHIPHVLYHWRVHAGSTAGGADAKPYAMLAGERALNEHFQRKGIQGKVSLMDFGYRAQYRLPVTPPLVSLLIPTRDHKAVTEVALRSILEKTTYPHYEIIIIDNGSVDAETLQWFVQIQAQDRRVRVIRYDHPFNYSAINNFGVGHAKGDVIGLINNDVEVISPDWLSEMVSHTLRPEIGCVGAKLYYSDGTVQHGGVVLGIGGFAGHSHKHFPKGSSGYAGRLSLISNFSAVTGACLLVRKEIFETAGGLDEDNLKVALNDVDFCLKVREMGYRNLWTPYAELYHHESISRGFEDTPEKQARFQSEVQFMKDKWGENLLQDPCYSPNLTLDHEDFSLAWPPRVESI